MNERETINNLLDLCKGITNLNTLESITLGIKALEKQIPKKPKILTYKLLTDSGWEYQCPNCGCAVGKNENLGFAYAEYLEPYEDYCCCCGQALDWRV